MRAGIRKIPAAFGALCVFLALLASPAVTGGPGARGNGPVSAPLSAMAEVQTIAPFAMPAPQAAPAPRPDATVERRCAASTILSRVVDADGTRVFHAEYSPEAFRAMLSRGCTRIEQGCNACRIDYTGCTAAERAACTDGDCLARVCKRRVLCTAKGCSAYGTKAPPCEARFARHACVATAFDALDSRRLPGQ